MAAGEAGERSRCLSRWGPRRLAMKEGASEKIEADQSVRGNIVRLEEERRKWKGRQAVGWRLHEALL